jgi:ABC-2 type transport system ATP-binding protein
MTSWPAVGRTPVREQPQAMAQADGSSVLRVRGLTKRYRGRKDAALDGADLDVPAGAIVALVGPNGAGKSTLIRCCIGFERPSAGRVLVDGIDPREDPTGVVARIGYVGQSPGLYRDVSAADHFAMARAFRPAFDRTAAERHLRALGIPADVRVGRLSGGEQAQVALALALGSHARLLLLDEPLASLDPLARREFLGIVRDAVVADGSGCILSSHIVADMATICDRVVVLADGRIRYADRIDRALATHEVVPRDAATPAELIGAFDDERGRPSALVRTADPRGPVTLDDVVLGYLAAARARRAVA